MTPRLRRAFARLGYEERATQLVELALLVPILLVLIFGIIDFGRGFFTWMIITNGAREGARAAAVGKPLASVVTQVQGAVGGLVLTGIQTGVCTDPTEGVLCITPTNVGGLMDSQVTVAVRYNFKYIVLPNVAGIVGATSLPKGILPLSAKATMRLE